MRNGLSGTGSEAIIANFSDRISAEVGQIAQNAKSEEEVRLGVVKEIDIFINAAGLKITGRHEYGLAGGRIDSKYGGVILEFKRPNGQDQIGDSLRTPGARRLVAQIRQRFQDFHTYEKIIPGRLFGVGCDSKKIIFIRYRAGDFDVEAPQPITPYTIERLLRALLSLGAKGYSYSPDNLTRDFGATSDLARFSVESLFDALRCTQNKKAQTLFSQWAILYGEVCGYEVQASGSRLEELAEYYGIKASDPSSLLYALHSYYAIFMKFLAAEIAQSFSPLGTSILRRCITAPSSVALRREMERLEHGGIWSQLGISNFLEGDLFSWHLPAWNDGIAQVIRRIAATLDAYDPSTLSVEPSESRDLLKYLYQRLFPGKLRHALGEYYTPDWLADHLLDALGYEGNPDTRILDPACGSGTFLVLAINRIKDWFETNRDQVGYGEAELVRRILSNVIGFDLNPLAVMAARTNYLLAIRSLLRVAGNIELPIYMCDSVMVPSEYGSLLEGGGLGKLRKLQTSVGDLLIPAEIVEDRELLGRYADIIERGVRAGEGAADFLDTCRSEGIPVSDPALHEALFAKLSELQASDQNGIWARIIRNAFAPLFVGLADYVVGNPPWVNWESLPEDYRKSTWHIWERYGLFPHRGYRAKLGAAKDDLSILMTYVAHDAYLRDGGKLGFVITQSVFKTTGGGEGFRHFQYDKDGRTRYLGISKVDDFSSLQPFEGVTNRTATFIADKAACATRYPVEYTLWTKSKKGKIDQTSSLAEAKSFTKRETLFAEPVEQKNIHSPWLTVPRPALPGTRKAGGHSPYSAIAGTTTWLNGVYWVEVLDKPRDNKVAVRNLHDVGKKRVKVVEAIIETDLLFPLIRGRDVSRWRAGSSANIIVPNERGKLAGIPIQRMRSSHRLTYEYFMEFERELAQRPGLRRYFGGNAPFYTIYNVGPYTFAPWKVVWPEVAHTVNAAVLGPENGSSSGVAIPDHTVIAVCCESAEEAHYICALLNSSPARLRISGYIVLHPSPHIMERVLIPRYSPRARLHRELSAISAACHAASATARPTASLEEELDSLAAELWEISPKELDAVRDALSETDPGAG